MIRSRSDDRERVTPPGSRARLDETDHGRLIAAVPWTQTGLVKDEAERANGMSHTTIADLRRLLAAPTGGRSFILGPTLPEAAVHDFDVRFALALPQEYHLFLTRVGNGGRLPGESGDWVLTPLAETHGGQSAASPFPITAERMRERLATLQNGLVPPDEEPFPELEHLWEHGDLPPGCLEVGRYPGGDAILLITSGDLRGSVWCSVNLGTPELTPAGEPLGFLDWFADALRELSADPGA